MASYTGSITFDYDVEHASNPEAVRQMIHNVLDTFGQHDFSHMSFTWDNVDWSIHEIETTETGESNG